VTVTEQLVGHFQYDKADGFILYASGEIPARSPVHQSYCRCERLVDRVLVQLPDNGAKRISLSGRRTRNCIMHLITVRNVLLQVYVRMREMQDMQDLYSRLSGRRTREAWLCSERRTYA
jgi:hypothetical protein